jgi:acyl dehydratase
MPSRLARYDDFAVGQRASFTKTLTEADIGHFIAITGDINPLHVDEEFARRTFFGGRIVQGMLSAAMFSTLVGCRLPGNGAIYRAQTLQFLRPAHPGDTLTAWLVVTRVDALAETLELDAGIDNQHGEAVIRGQTVVTLLRPGCVPEA